MQILVLGPPAIREDGQSLELRDRKGVGLLAYLAIQGRTTRDKLADLFWTDMNQADARRNLRQRLYELKGKLPDGCLNTDGDSVSLETSAQTDLEQFRESISAGNDEAAILLWRGAFLHGLELPSANGFDEWLEPMRETLNVAYHEALRRLATAREERGDLRGALEAHQRLLSDDELQEHHQRETIRLLEALGERETALQQYERYRQTLKRELDDVPLPQTQQLAQRVQHTIQRTITAPTATEPDALSLELRSPLIGREAEWTRLERAAHGLSLIVGEPGIGKSRLADELAYYTARHGSVRRLQGREGSSGSPLYPVAESLREALREPAWVQTLEPIWRVECARLVPEIDPQATPQPMPSLEGRVRFIEGLARALIASVGEQGVIVLDDLHWFDAATLELVGHLARRARDANVRLIATARTLELERNEAVLPILADLKRDGLLTRLDLEPLGERDVRSLIQSLSGGRDAPAFAKRLHAATVGNPFFLLETLRDLFGSGQLYVMADGTWTTPYDNTETYAELPIPTTVRETVIARVDRTGADARRLLEAASLAGDGFDLGLISSATALTEWEGVEAIERAVNAELLEPVNDGYRFNHDLIRRALEDGLNPDRKKLIHRKLAVSLESANGQPARIAEHYEMGGQARQAAPWWIKAAEVAGQIYAYREALSYYDRAILGINEKNLLQIYCKRVQLWQILDDLHGWQKDLEIVSGLTHSSYDVTTQIEIAMLDAEHEGYNRNHKNALKIIENTLQIPGIDKAQKIRLLNIYAQGLIEIGSLNQAEYYLHEILKYPKESNVIYYGRSYMSLAKIYLKKNEIEIAEKWLEEARLCFEELEMTNERLECEYEKSEIEYIKRNLRKSINDFTKTLNQAQKASYITLEKWCYYNLSRVYLDLCDYENTIKYLEMGEKMLSFVKDEGYRAFLLSIRAQIDIFEGKINDGIEKLKSVSNIMTRIKSVNEGYFAKIDIAICYISLNCNLEASKIINEMIVESDSGYYYLEKNWISLARKVSLLNSNDEIDFTLSELIIINKSPAEYSFIAYKIAEYLLFSKKIGDFLDIYNKYDQINCISYLKFSLELQYLIQNNEITIQKCEQVENLLYYSSIPILEKIEIEYQLVFSYQTLGREYDEKLKNITNKITEHIASVYLNLPNNLREPYVFNHSLRLSSRGLSLSNLVLIA